MREVIDERGCRWERAVGNGAAREKRVKKYRQKNILGLRSLRENFGAGMEISVDANGILL